MLGSVIGWLVAKERARGFVITASRLVIALGLTALVAGFVAVAKAQPYAVWYPLVLLGAISCGVMAPSYRRFVRRYRDGELRRLQALDAG